MANGDDESFMLLLKIDDEFAGKGNNAIYADRNVSFQCQLSKKQMQDGMDYLLHIYYC